VTAVEYLQTKQKVIHMDIKPENILVTSKDMIKLTDFGCFVKMGSPRRVHHKDNGGTRTYHPPELLEKGLKEFDSTVCKNTIHCMSNGNNLDVKVKN
jgi:serine/threonine protein kinase